MLTGDLNVAVVQWVLQWRVLDPRKFLFQAKNVEKNIRDSSISVMRRVVGDKLVSDVLTTDRITIAESAYPALSPAKSSLASFFILPIRRANAQKTAIKMAVCKRKSPMACKFI